ncbi:hypothetical protein C8R44DRAFT_774817 [Mycena epipterygia]|nr:hypothetical protein C8R44DRAFT_774817 [Mycena epipterygia]
MLQRLSSSAEKQRRPSRFGDPSHPSNHLHKPSSCGCAECSDRATDQRTRREGGTCSQARCGCICRPSCATRAYMRDICLNPMHQANR